MWIAGLFLPALTKSEVTVSLLYSYLKFQRLMVELPPLKQKCKLQTTGGMGKRKYIRSLGLAGKDSLYI